MVQPPQLFQNSILVEMLQPIDLFRKDDTGVIQWIVDSLLYSRIFGGYAQALEKVLQQMIVKNFRKCDLLSTQAECSSRILAEEAWNYSPKYSSRILKTSKLHSSINWHKPCT